MQPSRIPTIVPVITPNQSSQPAQPPVGSVYGYPLAGRVQTNPVLTPADVYVRDQIGARANNMPQRYPVVVPTGPYARDQIGSRVNNPSQPLRSLAEPDWADLEQQLIEQQQAQRNGVQSIQSRLLSVQGPGNVTGMPRSINK